MLFNSCYIAFVLAVFGVFNAHIINATPISGRVVGGEDATTGQFAHQISLRYGGSHICGGSVISRLFILTAAHCVSNIDGDGVVHVDDPAFVSIRAGTLDRFKGGMLIDVAEITVHENYGNFLNDVALLRLKEPLIFSNQIKPIPLASESTPTGVDVVISGWGRLRTGGDIPRQLQWNTLKSLSNARCNSATFMFTNSLICLAHTEGNGACNGDSGGPAIYNGEIVGIAGFVMGGCGSNNPDGYAKVFYHRDWIIKHAKL